MRRYRWITGGFVNPPYIVLLVLATVAQASAPLTVEKHAYRPYPPVEVTSYVIETPRPVRAWAAKVDLTSDDIEFVVTPRGTVEDEFETACATTLAFARSNGLQLAINATPFRPYRQKAGDGMEVVGLAASDGDVYSQPHPTFGALVLSKSGEANIVRPPFDRLAWRDVDEAVGGFRVLVEDGLSRLPRIINEIPPDFAAPNPRSAVGLSADRKTMWLIVVDGRIPGRSEGMSLEELADFAIGLGCDRLLNLDGGGSATLVVQDSASKVWRVVNQPVGQGRPDTLRLVANSLGIRIHSAETHP